MLKILEQKGIKVSWYKIKYNDTGIEVYIKEKEETKIKGYNTKINPIRKKGLLEPLTTIKERIINLININEIKNWKLLPFDNFIIESSMDKKEVLQRLLSNIEINENFNSGKKSSFKSYEGYITEQGFQFRRILKKGINSFIPVVIGSFDNQRNNAIRVKIRLNKFVLIFLSIFILFDIGLFFASSNFKEIKNKYPQELEEIFADNELKEILDEIDFQKRMKDLYHQKVNINYNALFISLVAYLMTIIIYNLELISVKQDLLFFTQAKILSK